MKMKSVALAAGLAGILSLATLPASAASIPAQSPIGHDAGVVQVRGGHGGHGGHFRGGHFRGGRGIGFGFALGAPLYYGYSSGGYYGNCGWLHRRAVDTGSRYWWRRYRECRGW